MRNVAIEQYLLDQLIEETKWDEVFANYWASNGHGSLDDVDPTLWLQELQYEVISMFSAIYTEPDPELWRASSAGNFMGIYVDAEERIELRQTTGKYKVQLNE